jgi:hypothetical protein
MLHFDGETGLEDRSTVLPDPVLLVQFPVHQRVAG